MQMPDANRIIKTGLAEAVLGLLIALAVWLESYIYQLGLLQRMLHLFPSLDGLGLLGFILIPILVVVMLVWGAFCALVTVVLVMFGLALIVALGFTALELLLNLFADPASHREPADLVQTRLRGIAAGTAKVLRRSP
ncbi:MAG: hypothetical protein ABSG76_13855 [Xanthobacteraceae bacterium]